MRFKRSPWSEDETVRLVAYLDHYAKKRSEGGKWSVKAMLVKLKTHIKSRSSKQIESKLLRLWGGPRAILSERAFQDVFKHGSRCLKWLADALRPLIQDTLKAIEISEASQRLNTPQTLRSGKERSVSIEMQRRTPFHSFLGVETPTKLPSKTSRTAALQRSFQADGGQTRNVSEALSTPSGGISTNIGYGLKTVKEETPSVYGMRSPVPRASASTDINTTSNDALVEVADSFESIPDVELEGFAEHPFGTEIEITKRRLFRLDSVQHVPTINYDRVSKTSSAFQTTNAGEMHEILQDLLHDNKHFRHKSSQLEQERLDFQREKRLKESLELRSAKDPEWSMFSVIREKDRLIADLRRSLTGQEFLKPFFQSSAYPHEPVDIKKIDNAFKGIASAIYCLAGIKEFQCSSTSLSGSDSEALNALIKRSLGHDSQSLSYEVEASQFTSSQLSCLMMQSLTGAAVCEWVFLTELRCAAMLSTPLLESYRYHLNSLCGEQGLRNLDIAAHQSLAHDEDFRQIYLSRTAARLAERLFAALSKVSTDDKMSEQEEDIKKYLENVFFHALTIKYEVMFSKDKFDIIWPAPNSVFEESLMDPYPPGSAKAARNGPESRVQLVIVPGLQCYTHDRKLGDDSAFLKAGEVRVGNPVRISKAIVSTK